MDEQARQTPMTLRRAVTLYLLSAVVLVAAASLLPGIAEQLAGVTGLQHSVVGTLFVAATTSLPEVVVSMAAMRMGALDMAVANLFGSNMFNVAVLGVDDLLYTRCAQAVPPVVGFRGDGGRLRAHAVAARARGVTAVNAGS